MQDPPETSELLAFVRAVELGSLSAASRDLALPRTTLVRRLDRLEERLGARLLRRSTRRLALTDAGEAVFGYARSAIDAVDGARRAVQRSDGAVRGLLRVSLPPLGVEFTPMLLEFREAYPEVQLEVRVTTDAVDLAGERYDVAVRASSQLTPGLVARVLTRGEVIAVASPAYLAQRRAPQRPEDLGQHVLICGFDPAGRPRTRWPLVGGASVEARPAFAANDLPLLVEAARRGQGIALLPEMMVEHDLAVGRLVQVLEGIVGQQTQVALVYPERELLPPPVRAFVGWVVARWERTTDAMRAAQRR